MGVLRIGFLASPLTNYPLRGSFVYEFAQNFSPRFTLTERWFIAPLALGNKSYRVAYKWKLEVSDVLLNINDEYNERDGTS